MLTGILLGAYITGFVLFFLFFFRFNDFKSWKSRLSAITEMVFWPITLLVAIINGLKDM